jgi:hypothetical protein
MSGAAPHPDPWTHARIVAAQLGAWSALSVAVGAAGLAAHAAGAWPPAWAPVVVGFSIQCLLWGVIDGAIAWFGARDRRRRMAAAGASDARAGAAFGARLLRLLRLNAGLDVLYVVAGIAVVALWRTPEGLGHGLGVIVQGGFLLAFDAWHGWAWVPRRVRAPAP